jgi:plasmid stabilization system protein ParE
MSGYILHPEAYTDLDAIWDFIAEVSPDAADRLLEQIYESILALVQFTHQGHWRFDLASKRVRFKTVGNYLIAYAPDEKPLLVLAVLHGRRSPRTIAAILRSRDE